MTVLATGALAHAPVLPVLLPSLTAIVLLLLGDARDGPRRLAAARVLSIVSVAFGLALSAVLVGMADTSVPLVYRVGEWPAPYGIVLVVDRLGALMLLLTSLVALPALVYATGGWDARGRHFHAMFQFQLMGLNGAFVTGDLFNLFVFFEVLLIASYVLMVHGLGRQRVRVGVHYVVLNLVASALFLVGVSLLYAKTGTLNFADLALRIAQVRGPDAAIVEAAGLVLFVVFGFKAALAPLSLWLPATYAAASPPVAALFALMTKVGVYAVIRVHGVAFGAGAGDAALAAQPLLLPLALATCAAGVVGALAAQTLARLVAWLTVASVGTALAAIGLYSEPAWSAGLYYVVGSTLVVAALFLLSELVGAQRGAAADRLVPAVAVAQPGLLGSMLLLAAAAAAGLPPLPGFVGKLMLLESTAGHGWQAAVWSVVLGAGLLSLVGLARAGSIVFWHVDPGASTTAVRAPGPQVAATAALLAATVATSVLAAPLQRYTDAAARQLVDVETYARAVLGPQGGSTTTTRPYRFDAPAGGTGPAAPSAAQRANGTEPRSAPVPEPSR